MKGTFGANKPKKDRLSCKIERALKKNIRTALLSSESSKLNQTKTKKKKKTRGNQTRGEGEKKRYLGGVKPDQIERVEIERRVRTVEDRPCSELRRRESRYDNPRELRVVAGKLAGGN